MPELSSDQRVSDLMLNDPPGESRRLATFAPGWKKVSFAVAIWVTVALLLAWALSAVSLSDVWAILSRLSGLQIFVLVTLNALIAFTFGWRWWLILRAQGYRVPYPALAGYRLASFSISYFTPGPHLGGEPLQVYLVRRRHAVPAAAAAASVSLDRLLELIVNFVFLLTGVVLTVQAKLASEVVRNEAILLVIVLLSVPVGLVWALYRGKHPVSSLLAKLSGLGSWLTRARDFASETEDQAAELCREHPEAILWALAGSAVVWCALLFEYWLSASFLGLNLTFVQLASMVTAARVAILLPSPGGLGTLEAGQVWMMHVLGLDPALGLGLSLLIRARYVLFGLIGLFWCARAVGGWQFLWGNGFDHEKRG
jgi:hypothetical protein